MLTWGAYPKADTKTATDMILARSLKRQEFYTYAVKLLAVAKIKDIRLIMENPWGSHSFLQRAFVTSPEFIDYDRTMRGDKFRKPTAYWYINCKATKGETICRLHEPIRVKKDAKGSPVKGICGEERSMMTPEYARNFIHDFILGQPQQGTQLSIF